jgi:hypothetical protein
VVTSTFRDGAHQLVVELHPTPRTA